ncbi:outer membrane beta-barrel protein [Xanthovirga aplysinae]|uniref:outer membrane beta-barrel protein n=1 Tax=Xanthovirga aplysinae TaxID=2529853 RepID=UPI0012BC14D2|nr:outer membrane beta-barrel protein [Xanthovirga aplysinae]MTI32894.1 hypothetical protein [Xanthovirga aplysinae]
MNKLITSLFLLFFLASLTVFANDNNNKEEEGKKDKKGLKRKYEQPDIPGIIYFSLGLNSLNNRPQVFKLNGWGSRTFEVYYFYNIPLGRSFLALRPGIGLSMNKFSFKRLAGRRDAFTLVDSTRTITLIEKLTRLDQFQFLTRVFKSQFELDFIDIPFFLYFWSENELKRKGFFVAIGARLGLRFDSKTKVKFRQDAKVKINKRKGKFTFNNTRVSIGARAGWKNFSAFWWWTTSRIFVRGQDPQQIIPVTDQLQFVGADRMNYMTFGFSVSFL